MEKVKGQCLYISRTCYCRLLRGKCIIFRDEYEEGSCEFYELRRQAIKRRLYRRLQERK
jgi:hypothetical protein